MPQVPLLYCWIPFIIFKVKPYPNGKPCDRKGTVTYELHHNIKENWGNEYPLTEECYITVSPTANSSGDHTLEYLKEVFFQRLVCKMALWRSPFGWCLMHFEVILTRRSRLTMQTIHCLNGSWWMVVSLQRPSLLTHLLTKLLRDSSVTSSNNGHWTHRPTQILATRWLHLVNWMHIGFSRRGPRFQKNLFGNRGKSVDTSQQRIWVMRRRRRVSQLSIIPRNS